MELKGALVSNERWLFMGIQDIKLRYRRTIIGPWWVTISTGILVAMLGILWSKIFGADLQNYLPYFAVVWIVWGWMSGQFSDAAG